jgi:hypothetical protein
MVRIEFLHSDRKHGKSLKKPFKNPSMENGKTLKWVKI